MQYDGRGLHGWQHQREHGVALPTVQGLLAGALGQMLGGMEIAPDSLVPAGRTDAGVHAWGQVVHVDVPKELPLMKFVDGMNRFLPPSVRVIRAARVADDFHARFDAVARRYVYLLSDRRQLRPDLVGRVGHFSRPLDDVAMAAALAKMGLGEMDCSGLRDAECQGRHPFCEIIEHQVGRDGEGVIRLEIEANRFLHHMVRTLVGTLVLVGDGKQPVDFLAQVLANRDRRLAGANFSPDGLYLAAVRYKPHREIEVAGSKEC